MSSVRVLEGGLCTTIQDLGRRGMLGFGIPACGVMDVFSASVANLLMGNSRDEALLEMFYTGASLEFLKPMHIAIGGADLSPKLNGMAICNWESYAVKPGDILSFGGLKMGVCAYVAFSGVLEVPQVHGSKATFMRAQMGGFLGRKLQKGDILPIRAYPGCQKRSLQERYRPLYPSCAHLHAVLAPQDHYFDTQSMECFLHAPYSLSRGDRMGIFLEGPTLSASQGAEMISEPLALGSIQVLPNGQPLILMADRQTVGGYPKIATLTLESVIALAQMRPKNSVHFVPCSVAEAQEKYRAFYQNLAQIAKSLD
ncbi:biotin-dependent carboxyltransferase family protein [Helicobacter baculiformis]|uniref:Biotin-dependent carboxyltransferase family protein n=1 Tax=Helicobacter baculiformis TaxID=427351 RepID=A0ABV7ZHA5_9HELI|nr:biotin-dependent carboxyltransferase family protein [Helicobacter baculiformis]